MKNALSNRTTDALSPGTRLRRRELLVQADSARVRTTPSSLAELQPWARQNPGRFSYPRPPQFIGRAALG